MGVRQWRELSIGHSQSSARVGAPLRRRRAGGSAATVAWVEGVCSLTCTAVAVLASGRGESVAGGAAAAAAVASSRGRFAGVLTALRARPLRLRTAASASFAGTLRLRFRRPEGAASGAVSFGASGGGGVPDVALELAFPVAWFGDPGAAGDARAVAGSRAFRFVVVVASIDMPAGDGLCGASVACGAPAASAASTAIPFLSPTFVGLIAGLNVSSAVASSVLQSVPLSGSLLGLSTTAGLGDGISPLALSTAVTMDCMP